MPSTDEHKQVYAKRFNLALDLYGVPQKNQGRSLIVAEMFGLTQRGAARWVNGEVLPPKARRREIATRFQVNFDWLEFGHGEPKTKPEGGNSLKRFPIITQIEAKDHKKVLSSFAGRKMAIETDASEDSFIIEVTGKAMEPSFGPGTIILVDPHATVKDGNYVLAYAHKLSEVLFRQYRLGDSHAHLAPMSDGFASIPMTREDQIIGVVVEAKQVLKP
jgi:SOS-response transcriptional repressor LexA